MESPFLKGFKTHSCDTWEWFRGGVDSVGLTAGLDHLKLQCKYL